MPQRTWNISQLRCNVCTGELTKDGKVIGSRRKDGYVEIGRGRQLNNALAHRVLWRIVYGYWPTEIDHIDGNPSNNSIWNLVDTNHQANLMNSEFHRSGKVAKRRRPQGWRRPRILSHLWS